MGRKDRKINRKQKVAKGGGARVDQDRSFSDDRYSQAFQSFQAGRFEESADLCRGLLDDFSDHAEGLHLLGAIDIQGGNYDSAIEHLTHATRLKPDHFYAYYNLGNALVKLGRVTEGIACYKKSIAINSDFVQALENLGAAFLANDEVEEAIVSYRRALDLNLNSFVSNKNLGFILQKSGNSGDAINYLKKALDLDPSFGDELGQVIVLLRSFCDWAQIDALESSLDQQTRAHLKAGRKPSEEPFTSLFRHADARQNYAVAKAWTDDAYSQLSNTLGLKRGTRNRKEKITIGYLSGNFKNHALGYLYLGLLERHDRHAVEVFSYSYGKDDGSECRGKIKRLSDRFVDLQDLDDADAAQLICDDQVDILIDLAGHTEGNRMGICALRPAPIQVRYLGLPGTTATDFFDYLITDKIVTPPSDAPYYSERFVYLPDCYQVNNYTQITEGHNLLRSDLGLPEDAFVFCSFNTSYKFDPVMFDCWVNILKLVPGSVLWLRADNEIVRENLILFAEERGLAPKRLIFTMGVAPENHLERIGLADLALDTRIVNGAATTSDALWAGVPVVTLQGQHFASRMSSSILSAIGLPELITHNIDEYEALAVRLATNPGDFQTLRGKLVEKQETEALFDTSRFTRNLEKVFYRLWNLHLSGEAPRSIEAAEVQNEQSSLVFTDQRQIDEQIHRAEESFAAGLLDVAEKSFLEVLEIVPKHIEVLNNLGVVCHARGNVEKAEKYFLASLAEDKNYLPTMLNLADLYEQRGDWLQAVDFLSRCADQDPALLNRLAVALMETGQIKEALSILHKSLELDPRKTAGQESVIGLNQALKTEEEAILKTQVGGFSPQSPGKQRLRVIHCPLIIANHSLVLSKYLKRLGVDSTVISYFRTWLNYAGDINLELDDLNQEQRQKKVQTFVDDFMTNEAAKYDIFHFHFFESLAWGSSFGGWQSHVDKDPLWDLQALKEMGKKIVISGHGSDVRNNSKITYYQLKYLYPDLVLPYPPLNRADQYQKIWQAAQFADAMVFGDSEMRKHVPQGMLIPYPIDLEPLEPYRNLSGMNGRPSILHAPTNNSFKGTRYVMRVLERVKQHYGDKLELRLIQGIPHREALKLYSGDGLAVDQINMSFGLFALEAMYLGRPVICSMRMEEFTAEEPKASAPVISVDNEQDFYARTVGFFEGDRVFSKDEMTAYVVDNHAAEKIAAEYKNLYQALVAQEPIPQLESPQWQEEFSRVKQGQSPDLQNYYSKVSDVLLASHDGETLEHEFSMGLGLANDVELLAKVYVAWQAAGRTDQAEQLFKRNYSRMNMQEFDFHRDRAQEIWAAKTVPSDWVETFQQEQIRP